MDSVSASGTIESAKTKKISANLQNVTVKKVYVKEGDEVKKGDVLVGFNQSDLKDSYEEAKENLSDTKSQTSREVSSASTKFSSMTSSMSDMIQTVSIAIAFIAGISLLVGGIGVMNIMLVSITERTKEIGTRKALGATNNFIRLQFITESVMLCVIGGVLGIVLGLSLGAVAASALGYAASAPLLAIVISVGFSMFIGVTFGYYPANKAARIDPIEALRYE